MVHPAPRVHALCGLLVNLGSLCWLRGSGATKFKNQIISFCKAETAPLFLARLWRTSSNQSYSFMNVAASGLGVLQTAQGMRHWSIWLGHESVWGKQQDWAGQGALQVPHPPSWFGAHCRGGAKLCAQPYGNASTYTAPPCFISLPITVAQSSSLLCYH